MIWILIIGFMVGAVAKFLIPGREPGGIILTILLGIGGSMLASWAGGAIGIYRHGEAVSFVAAVVGAMAIIFLYNLRSNRKNV
jgi:uncharacterized membrane protein YeaQ/YmgE (transglycosylase-associated protein family)